jgi:type IV pilus assembly protein PilV
VDKSYVNSWCNWKALGEEQDMKNSQFSHITQQRGMTLLEVLVAVVILAIGLLGVAGLQSRGQSATAEASIRTYTTILANELLDRMRTNRDVAAAGGYATAEVGTSTKDCREVECSHAELRDFDYSEWLDMVSKNLPSGSANIVYNTAGATTPNPSRYEVTITWALKESESDTPTDQTTLTKSITWVVAP